MCVCRSCSSWNHITINNFLFRTEVSTTRLSNRMSYTCSYASFRCQTPICCSHAWVWRIPKFRHLSPWFPNGEFPQFSTDLLGQHLFNLLQPSKKKQQQKLFCSAISNCYTKLAWFLGKKLGRCYEKPKNFQNCCSVSFCAAQQTVGVYDLGLQTFNSEFPRMKRAWSRTGANDAAMQDTFVLVLWILVETPWQTVTTTPISWRSLAAWLVTNWEKNHQTKHGVDMGWSLSQKKKNEPSKFKAFCFPLNINLFCYIPKMPTETNGENSTQLQGCDSPL